MKKRVGFRWLIFNNIGETARIGFPVMIALAIVFVVLPTVTFIIVTSGLFPGQLSSQNQIPALSAIWDFLLVQRAGILVAWFFAPLAYMVLTRSLLYGYGGILTITIAGAIMGAVGLYLFILVTTGPKPEPVTSGIFRFGATMGAGHAMLSWFALAATRPALFRWPQNKHSDSVNQF